MKGSGLVSSDKQPYSPLKENCKDDGAKLFSVATLRCNEEGRGHELWLGNFKMEKSLSPEGQYNAEYVAHRSHGSSTLGGFQDLPRKTQR